jgi:hypothetical protein
MTKNQSASGTKSSKQPRRVRARIGNCSRKPSAVRPVSSSFPAFMLNPNSDPLGFPGFATRGGFSGL